MTLQYTVERNLTHMICRAVRPAWVPDDTWATVIPSRFCERYIQYSYTQPLDEAIRIWVTAYRTWLEQSPAAYALLHRVEVTLPIWRCFHDSLF
jgi:hypothetical protein